ncbi:MAG: type II toxin-antitoxin system RelE family toxin [Solirubrobacterales bacterium]
MSPSRRSLRYATAARRDLRRLDPPVRRRVVSALERLASEDRSLDVRHLAGRKQWRLRVGSWRVIFERDSEDGFLIRRVLPRGRAYER